MDTLTQYETSVLNVLNNNRDATGRLYLSMSVSSIIEKCTLKLTISKGAITYPEVTSDGVIEHVFTVYDLLKSLCDKHLIAEVIKGKSVVRNTLDINSIGINSEFKKVKRYLVRFMLDDTIKESYIPYLRHIEDIKDGFWLDSNYEITNNVHNNVIWLPPTAIRHVITI